MNFNGIIYINPKELVTFVDIEFKPVQIGVSIASAGHPMFRSFFLTTLPTVKGITQQLINVFDGHATNGRQNQSIEFNLIS
jgi:hypothetical protein